MHQMVWSCSKDFDQCSEVTRRHADWANSLFDSIHLFAVRHHNDPTDPARLTISHDFATFKRDALGDQHASVKILRDALSTIEDLSEARLEALSDENCQAVDEIPNTLEQWEAPFVSPFDPNPHV
jgi:hypothetical protein